MDSISLSDLPLLPDAVAFEVLALEQPDRPSPEEAGCRACAPIWFVLRSAFHVAFVEWTVHGKLRHTLSSMSASKNPRTTCAETA